MMYQQEIEFFWPLTEQIPLDLDYSVCEKPKLSVTDCGITNITINNGNLDTTISFIASNFNIDVDTTTIKVKEEPNLIRKALYKGLGLKWELKNR